MPSDDVERAREEVIDALARSAEIYGLNRSYGRLYGILYFADDPLSLDDLVEESGYAKSTVSTAMGTLQSYQMVHRQSLPGEGKRAFFEAERDFWYIAREFLRQKAQREVDVMLRALESAETALEDAESEQAERDLEKIRTLKQVYRQSDRLISLLAGTSIDRLIDVLSRLRGDSRS
ncbi:GbsR/MarR family transcriptional regulator [Haloarchaeobius amylolyticus]|uniref:GbsR/MarR family transcriptional regulator n=1 Tax=Haloarchaeobius amylolyticus TaxID=1198296 RepID=UPI00226F5D72|nr:transcriptional regulator [Haloarchaeobius amylolyticus]